MPINNIRSNDAHPQLLPSHFTETAFFDPLMLKSHRCGAFDARLVGKSLRDHDQRVIGKAYLPQF